MGHLVHDEENNKSQQTNNQRSDDNSDKKATMRFASLQENESHHTSVG